MSDFKKLKVWEKAHELALRVHRAAAQIRGAQNVALRSQLTRAAQSIPSNIVEGAAQRAAVSFFASSASPSLPRRSSSIT